VVLWEEVEDKLTKKSHSKLRQRLISRTEKNLPVFVEALTVRRRGLVSVGVLALETASWLQRLYS